jgi:D-arabinose 1-dehydrogenase-like Zn-dependent alcohol dehydrogenase
MNGAAEVIDHTSTEVTAAVTEPVDVLLNLAPINPEQFAALVTLVRDGGVVASTTVWMPLQATISAVYGALMRLSTVTLSSSRT